MSLESNGGNRTGAAEADDIEFLVRNVVVMKSRSRHCLSRYLDNSPRLILHELTVDERRKQAQGHAFLNFVPSEVQSDLALFFCSSAPRTVKIGLEAKH